MDLARRTHGSGYWRRLYDLSAAHLDAKGQISTCGEDARFKRIKDQFTWLKNSFW